ncbi:XRE family transcriptional regulator [Mesorhizobium sp. M00.F.Ca.ET.186.01.1.1]|nr:XRE family transcriptional regulator [bacterium M00.F.Ca.ET.205.01.1.1]TGU54097.1 XRE family transcriptional regulator [bacterium M00.F.Ca.ET.152.01.1.1]TGV36841.1 XRE family transcriptional regulator [Mesorhizobium sp. M00.F.Ca.ET.186.01.1.1]TGZ41784.1 XRE family transcriptional regulator [bacterium M00.F.Ca.ET.162.01.1.1]
MDSRDLLSAEQARVARALLKWSRVRLAAKANLSEATIGEFEKGKKPRPRTVAAIRRALEAGGIVFADKGSPSLAYPEGRNTTDNRAWRHRQTERPAR